MLSTNYPPATRGKLVLWGLLGSSPFGGMIWQVLHYLVGLRRLGFDVWYVEDSDKYVYDPVTYWPTRECGPNVELLSKYMKSVGLGDRWVFRPPEVEDQCLGSTNMAGLTQLYREADAVFNLCGSQELLPRHADIPCLVYVQTDPVPEQVWVASGDQTMMSFLDTFHYLFTYGENLGAKDCPVPMGRYRWEPTRPPVCMDWWRPEGPPPKGAALTTIANLKHTDKDVRWKGETWHWSKHLEFQKFITLPTRSSLPLAIALGSNGGLESAIRLNGWGIIPSGNVADPESYRRFIWESGGEFTVAKGQYVHTRSGWFSDRSVCYLASGRPVVTQDTGFGKFIPTGKGLFAFSNEDEALAAIDAVSRDYRTHSAAARDIAAEFFDAKPVLEKMVRHIGLL